MKMNKIFPNEDWIREWQDDDNLDWFEISEHVPFMSINFCREFKDKIKWLWVLYAPNIESREDIISEFDLESLMEGYKEYNDPN